MRLEVSSGIDWFDLHGTVEFGDGRSAPFPQLLAAIARGEDVVVLDDGSVGLLPEEWLRRYAADRRVRRRSKGMRSGSGRSQAALLDALLAAQPAIAYDEVFERVRVGAADVHRRRRRSTPPPSFQGTLREYQREALGWFDVPAAVRLRRLPGRRHGARQDRHGAGAARGAAHAPGRKGIAVPSLVVVPRSLVFNWMEEAARFAPKLKVLDHTGPLRAVAGDRRGATWS